MSKRFYVPNPAVVTRFFDKLPNVGAPGSVDAKWLSQVGFKTSNDYALIGLLEFLGFVDSSGKPTDLWSAYRNKSQSRRVMAQAIRSAYAELYSTYPDAGELDDSTLLDFFRQATKLGESTLSRVLHTFCKLVALADMDAACPPEATKGTKPDGESEPPPAAVAAEPKHKPKRSVEPLLPISMNIQIVIPSDASEAQYDAIFSSIKRNLLADDE
ncbi:MAG: DUF5343 domain-containing protein [Anaerolineae bacterium]